MPYQRVTELPETVKNSLPESAQNIYLNAFNSAWEQYDLPSERRGNDSREETAHKVAWAAVKNVNHKNKKNEWVHDNHQKKHNQ